MAKTLGLQHVEKKRFSEALKERCTRFKNWFTTPREESFREKAYTRLQEYDLLFLDRKSPEEKKVAALNWIEKNFHRTLGSDSGNGENTLKYRCINTLILALMQSTFGKSFFQAIDMLETIAAEGHSDEILGHIKNIPEMTNNTHVGVMALSTYSKIRPDAGFAKFLIKSAASLDADSITMLKDFLDSTLKKDSAVADIFMTEVERNISESRRTGKPPQNTSYISLLIWAGGRTGNEDILKRLYALTSACDTMLDLHRACTEAMQEISISDHHL